MINNQQNSPCLQSSEKPYLYTLTYDNSWNNPNLTSSKVSRYYHDIQQRFLNSPKSPKNQLIADRLHQEIHQKKTMIKHKASAKNRLNARRKERTELEEYCRKSTGSPLPKISHIRMASQLAYSVCDAATEYHKYQRLPENAKKMVYTEKIASIEANSVNFIVQKTQELTKIEEDKKERIKLEMMRQRQKLIENHRKIEEKSGIRKVRVTDQEDFEVTTFGFGRKYKFHSLCERLSQPKVQELFSYGKSDLRGLVNTSPHLDLCQKESLDGSTMWITDSVVRRSSA